MTFSVVEQFENEIAKYFNATYAVATDCCTHAIELCLRYKNIQKVSCPKHTYLSVPMTFEKLGLDWSWTPRSSWQDFYYLKDTNIIDAAVYWKENGYIPGTFMCLSFQFKKHLSLGRGGAILCDNKYDYMILKAMSYDGRTSDKPWATQNVKMLGYHYYMTPETAQLGLDKLNEAKSSTVKKWDWSDYPDLSKMEVFDDL